AVVTVLHALVTRRRDDSLSLRGRLLEQDILGGSVRRALDRLALAPGVGDHRSPVLADDLRKRVIWPRARAVRLGVGTPIDDPARARGTPDRLLDVERRRAGTRALPAATVDRYVRDRHLGAVAALVCGDVGGGVRLQLVDGDRLSGTRIAGLIQRRESVRGG